MEALSLMKKQMDAWYYAIIFLDVAAKSSTIQDGDYDDSKYESDGIRQLIIPPIIDHAKIAAAMRRPRTVQLLCEPIEYDERAGDPEVTWSAQVNEFGRKVAQSLVILGPLLNPISGL